MSSKVPRMRAALYALAAAGLYNKVVPGDKRLANAAVAATLAHRGESSAAAAMERARQQLVYLAGSWNLAIKDLGAGNEGLVVAAHNCVLAAADSCLPDAEEALTGAAKHLQWAKEIFEHVLKQQFDFDVAEAFVASWLDTYGPATAVAGDPLPDTGL